MKINDTIQELFEGSLADEQSAELFHALSVSPERRVDFMAYVALMGAMQRDRAASALTSDEDSEIWGVLAGLGAATVATGAGSAIWSWLAKGSAVVLVGVIGYILGTTFTSNKTVIGGGNGAVVSGSKNSARTQGPAASTNAGGNGTSAGGAATAAGSPAPQGAPSSATSIASVAAATRSGEANAPKILYRDRIVYRNSAPINSAADGGAGSSLLANSTRPSQPANGSNGANAANPNDGNGGGNSTNPNNATKPANPNNGANSTNAANPNDGRNPIAPEQQLRNAAKDSAGAAKDIASRNPINPKDAMATPAEKKPATPQEPLATALHRDGIEVGLSERVGILAPKPKEADHSPIFSTHHLDISYRFGDGRFGLGARLGYGTFSPVTLYPIYTPRQNARGELSSYASYDTVYHSRLQTSTQAFTEFFANYRIPLSNRLAISAEAAYGTAYGTSGSDGTSAAITKVGGDIYFLYFLSERFVLQGGGGVSGYWYSLEADVNQKLKDGGDGTSVVDDVSPSYSGTMLELRYGILYHF